LHEKVRKYVMICRWILLVFRKLSRESYRDNQSTDFACNIFCIENHAVYEIITITTTENRDQRSNIRGNMKWRGVIVHRLYVVVVIACHSCVVISSPLMWCPCIIFKENSTLQIITSKYYVWECGTWYVVLDYTYNLRSK
jgi:hypothetical protein